MNYLACETRGASAAATWKAELYVNTYDLTDFCDRYGGYCLLRSLWERRSARCRRHAGGAGLVAHTLLRGPVRRQPRREAEGLRPLRQATHHVDCSYAQHSFTELGSARYVRCVRRFATEWERRATRSTPTGSRLCKLRLEQAGGDPGTRVTGWLCACAAPLVICAKDRPPIVMGPIYSFVYSIGNAAATYWSSFCNFQRLFFCFERDRSYDGFILKDQYFLLYET